jgi:hypothetical protein
MSDDMDEVGAIDTSDADAFRRMVVIGASE